MIARNLKGALATRAGQKGACILKRSRPFPLPNDLSLLAAISRVIAPALAELRLREREVLENQERKENND